MFIIGLQWIAHGTLGDLGAHVQRHAAQEPCLTQDPRMGHIMVEAIAQGHHPNQLHAMQIAVLVSIPKLQDLRLFRTKEPEIFYKSCSEPKMEPKPEPWQPYCRCYETIT